MATIEATHTRVLVRFHSDQNPGGEAIEIGGPAKSDSRFGRLIAVQTDKRLADPTGGFTIYVKKPDGMSPSRSLSRIWPDPEDVWVEIVWIVNGEQVHTMTGLVDQVSDTLVRADNGKRVEAFMIIGRDIGKVFVETQLWINLFDFGDEGVKSIGSYMNAILDQGVTGRPDEWVRRLIETWMGNNGLAEQQWLLPGSLGGASFFDKLDLDGIEEMGPGSGSMTDPTILDVDLSNGFGRLWDTLGRYSNDLLNEMWVDLQTPEDGADASALAPTIYLRERPFPTWLSRRTKWDAIKRHVLDPVNVQRRRMSKGGAASRFNYWMISSAGLIDVDEQSIAQTGVVNGAAQGRPGNIPIWNADSIRQHGVRRWMRSSTYLAVDPTILTSLSAVWLQRVHDWYSIAPMQLSGSLETTKAFPEIRVGHRLLEKRLEGDVEYYVEGVSHIWQYPGASHTTLTLTRGQFADEDLLKVIYDQIAAPKTLDQESCLELSSAVDAALGGDILGGMGCKFDSPFSRKGEAFFSHGGAGFEVSGAGTVPDESSIEQAGKALISEGGSLFGGSARTSRKGSKGGMLPPKDRQNAQADEIALGNPNARISKPSRGPFDKAALERGDDPLAGFDDEYSTDDPLYGLDLEGL